MPRELFKAAPLAPGKKAPSPKGSKSEEAEAPSPDAEEDDEPADQTASDGVRINGEMLLMSVVFGLWMSVIV